MNENRPLNIALIGFGFMGRIHASKFKEMPGAHLHSIIDSKEENLQDARELYPASLASKDLCQVIDQIDAAIIATSTPCHFHFIELLLNRGKHILCEKPLCSNLSDAQKVLKIIRVKKDLVLGVGHIERYQKVWDNLEKWREEILNNGPVTIKMNRLNTFKGRSLDVDVVYDLMIHDLDLMNYIFHDLPEKVSTFGQKTMTHHWDQVFANFTFKDGSRVEINSSRTYWKNQRSIEILGSEKSIYIDLLEKSYFEVRYNKSLKTYEKSEIVHFENLDLVSLEIENFISAIKGKEKMKAQSFQGMRAILLAESVLKSLEHNFEISVNDKK